MKSRLGGTALTLPISFTENIPGKVRGLDLQTTDNEAAIT